MASINQHPAMQSGNSKSMSNIPTPESSFLENFTYDPATLQLTVTMKNGAQYLHFFVYPQTIEELIKAPSKGKFYANVIKKAGGKSVNVVTKTIGPQNRNPLKGPINHDRRITKTIARSSY